MKLLYIHNNDIGEAEEYGLREVEKETKYITQNKSFVQKEIGEITFSCKSSYLTIFSYFQAFLAIFYITNYISNF